ncbi:MAG: glycosyltransferase family 4 protein [Gemmatimonadota bacterium]|nr:glycosyltransferase family 4 protein [Gemmatimonadota bacterium]HEU4989680.1 glycosyltransferase family 4 protein [Gemmatimonadaceae bacterium]
MEAANTPLRILLLGDYAPDPQLGSSKVYYKLHEELTRLGHMCDVMLGPDLGVHPRQPKIRWAAAPVLAARAVARTRTTYDVIDVASAEGSVLGLRAALTAGARPAIVSRSHGLEHRNYERLLEDHAAGLTRKGWPRRWWYPAARLSQVAMAARLADRMIVLSAGDAEFVVARGWKARDRIDVIPHGVSERFLASAPPAGGRRGSGLLFCGTWDDVKGSHYLAAAFSDLINRMPSARMTVLGAARPPEYVLSQFSPEARPAVTVLPRVPEDAVMQHYRAHDALVVASTYEGFGMVILEAMSQRLPVISTPVGCAPALIRDGESGLLVRPRSPEDLAAAMARVLGDAELRERLANAAYPLAAAHTWARTAAQTVQAYRAAMVARGGVS